MTDTATYDYDDNGSLTSRTNTNGDSLTQTWSLRNRLAGATVVRNGVTTNTSYVYADSGIRVSTTENGTTRLLLIDGMTPNGYAQVVEEYSSGGILLASFVYGIEPLSQSQGGVVSFYLMDGHSGVRIVVDPAATVLNRYRFDAYGMTLTSSGSMANPLLYRGERFDVILGQYYLRARFYDPTIGRFTRVDPSAGRISRPVTLQDYGYANADHVTYIDPTGWEGTISLNVRIAISLAIGTLFTLGSAAYGWLNYWMTDPREIGKAVERVIFWFYRPWGYVCNRQIGTIGNPPFGGVYRSRPDIRHHRTGEVYEVKPHGLEIVGQSEVRWFYIPALQAHDAANGRFTPWHPGRGPLLTPQYLIVPELPMLRFRIRRPVPGVITYEPKTNWPEAIKRGAIAAAIAFSVLTLWNALLELGAADPVVPEPEVPVPLRPAA